MSIIRKQTTPLCYSDNSIEDGINMLPDKKIIVKLGKFSQFPFSGYRSFIRSFAHSHSYTLPWWILNPLDRGFPSKFTHGTLYTFIRTFVPDAIISNAFNFSLPIKWMTFNTSLYSTGQSKEFPGNCIPLENKPTIQYQTTLSHFTLKYNDQHLNKSAKSQLEWNLFISDQTNHHHYGSPKKNTSQSVFQNK